MKNIFFKFYEQDIEDIFKFMYDNRSKENVKNSVELNAVHDELFGSLSEKQKELYLKEKEMIAEEDKILESAVYGYAFKKGIKIGLSAAETEF